MYCWIQFASILLRIFASTNNKCWRGCGKREPSYTANENKKLEIDPAIPLLGIHTEETRRERDTCTPTLIAALFIIARTWKQPRCPSADEWIRKL